ncbi:WD40 repeat-like protein [Mycena venus]|uniref:WD40 repeat-like protein n=1 Tax=Mycena venus TaxID=2733690 RepID=A0A8H6Y836_9AGAR|nr:WD40 repeat-like protein [Mycena venus]
MSVVYSLSVQSADGIQWNPGPLRGQNPKLYVKIYLDGKQIGRTRTAKRTRVPQWDDEITISSEKATAVLSLKLHHDTSVVIRKDPCIGVLDIQLDTLSNLCSAATSSKVINLQLVAAEGPSQGKPSATLSVHMKNLTLVQAKSAIDAAKNDIEARALGSPVDDTTDFAAGLKVVITKLDIIIKIGDGISEINPYAKAAWKTLTVVYETVKKQQYRDEKVLELVQAMIEVYSFVEDTKFISDKVRCLENLVTAVVKQTWECAIFIREYTGHGFGGRLIRNTWSDTNQKVEGLSEALLKLKDAFDRGLAFQTVFFSVAIKADTEYLVQSDRLKSLNPLELDASQRTMCLPGTRQDVLAAITDWLTAPALGANILWLHGVAGSGKSTISTTISQYCRNIHRLGAFLFFDRNNPAGNSPGGVIRTVAYWMAMSNAHIRAAICDAITSDAALAIAPIQTQFQKLLLDPLNAAGENILGPITVILDALDECGNAESRETLVSLMINEFPKIPLNFRFFITSRPESDIASRFRGCQHISEMQLDIRTEAVKQDIVAYIHERMGNLRQFKRSLEPEWPGQHIIETLAEYSGGLFIWAATACKFIRSFDPKKRLEIILAAGVSNDLDKLYTIALQNSANWTNEDFAQDACSILGVIVLSRVPLTDRTIDKLLPVGSGRSADVLEYLGCIIQWGPGQSARILHASFSDYITSPARCGDNPWFIDSRIQSRLEDSHVLNIEVSKLHIIGYCKLKLKPASKICSKMQSDSLEDFHL